LVIAVASTVNSCASVIILHRFQAVTDPGGELRRWAWIGIDSRTDPDLRIRVV
jgi:hypothetical protein